MHDHHQYVNPVLRKIMREIYRNRIPLPVSSLCEIRQERVNDQLFFELWFMTPGCSHDRRGGCTMCNYGKGHCLDENRIVDRLREKICSLPSNIQELIVTPSGSMLDEQEVPESLFLRVLDLVNSTQCQEFTIESRAEFVSDIKLRQLADHIHANHYNIEMGVECCNEWVLRNCVNKNLDLRQVMNALDIIHANNMYAVANIGVGIPMISEKLNIELAKTSLRQVLDMGFDSAVLFPYHVKPGTFLEWLWKRGLYHCCSLWSLPEILTGFGDDELSRISISWYRNNYKDPGKILCSPTSCGQCERGLLTKLDEYRNHPGKASLGHIYSFDRSCREAWEQSLDCQSDSIEFEKIEYIYRMASEEFGVSNEDLEYELRYMRQTLEGYNC